MFQSRSNVKWMACILLSSICGHQKIFITSRADFLRCVCKIVDYSCAFNKDYYLQHGALYVTSNYICFRSNIFGHERKLVIPTAEVRHVDKVNTFRLIPSGIAIITADEKVREPFWG